MDRPLGKPRPFAHYDQRRYPTLDVRAGYALWSRCYGELEARLDLHLLEGSSCLGECVPGASVVDLGCGNGRIGKWLAGRGARSIVGVDLTPEMLEGAAARGVYERTLCADVARTGLPEASFDGAVSSMVLCHVPDLAPFYEEAARIVRPGGWLAIVDYHPFFLMNGIPTHFDDPSGSSTAITNHVHALHDFFQVAVRAGFAALDFQERYVTEEWIAASGNYAKHLGRPVTHLWVYRRN